MTLALRYAVRSDVGLLREGNEDSAYAGPHLLAVADGMGGHAAGEVASAATITTIAPLDDARHLGPDLVGALADAVATANLRLQELIISDPAIEGMGTTLTALLWADGYAALCHIGDSRAYRLRNGQFLQITHDHTLVQSLVDEGKITEDDVATHPHRSLLLRALDGRTVAEPDLAQLETLPGDRYLLCSDGLSGVVTEQTLHQTLSAIRDPDKAALQLVELAIRGGGPDNITCIVADVMDTQASAVPPTWTPVLAGAAQIGAPADLRQPVRQSSPATRAMRLTRTAPQPAVPDESATGAWPAGPGTATPAASRRPGSKPTASGAGPAAAGPAASAPARTTPRASSGFPATRTKTSTTSPAAGVGATAPAATATAMTTAMTTVTAADAAGRSSPARWCCWCCCSAAARTAPGGTTSSSTTSACRTATWRSSRAPTRPWPGSTCRSCTPRPPSRSASSV